MTTVLITGASAGIGAEFARQFAARGDDLVLVARNADRLEELAAQVRQSCRIRTEVLAADLADRTQLRRVEERLRDETRPVDILVNNAGFGLTAPFVGGDLDGEQELLDVMVTAVMRLTHAALPGMVNRGRGGVINNSSVASFIAGGTYSAAKAWVRVFSESLHAPMASKGVTVTALCPGYTHTEFHERAGINKSRVQDWMWLDSQMVVAESIRDFGRGKAVSIPSGQYKLLSAAASYLPRPLVRRVGLASQK
jgi:short-subunit dehydrogenase